MPISSKPLRKLGFLTIGLFDPADPRAGHESTLEIIQLGEQLGFDSAWVRHRHLQYGISSPVAVLAAASQRTTRIELGTAVIPLGWENPLRLAEDLATVDLLSGGRLNPGMSVGPPMHWDQVEHALYPDTAQAEDFSYERVNRLLRFVRGEVVTDFSGVEGIEVFSDRVAAVLRRIGRPHVVRRSEPALGPVGGRERDELPDQQRRPGRAVGGLRRGPALAYPDLPRPSPRWRAGARVTRPGRHSDRLGDRGPAGEVRAVRAGAHARARPARRGRVG